MSNSKKILIVEDDSHLAKAITDKLEREGFEIHHAGDGQNGLKMALEYKPDLILLDIVMPVMSGEDMLAELRKDDWGRDANVIMLTNIADPEIVIDAMDTGASDYIVKTDWKLEDILKKIRAVLS